MITATDNTQMNKHEYSNKTLLTKQAVGQIQTIGSKFAKP